jgi:hypothetical protein
MKKEVCILQLALCNKEWKETPLGGDLVMKAETFQMALMVL